MSSSRFHEELIEEPRYPHEPRARRLHRAAISRRTVGKINIRLHDRTIPQALAAPIGEAVRSCITIPIGAILCVNSRSFALNSRSFASNSRSFASIYRLFWVVGRSP